MSVIYTRPALRHLLDRARRQGLDLAQGSSLEKMTVAQLAELVKERENNMNDIGKAVSPLSARQRAEQLLAFREADAPNNKRFQHRALLVDNGGRGSDQKAMTFDADDLSALMMDLRCAEAELLALRQRHEAMTQAVGLATTIKDDMAMRADDPIGMMQEVCAYVDALRQRHAEDVEKAFREGRVSGKRLFGTDNAAWLASEAKARLT